MENIEKNAVMADARKRFSEAENFIADSEKMFKELEKFNKKMERLLSKEDDTDRHK